MTGHHVQVEVKFLDLQTEDGQKAQYFQYPAIDDATRTAKEADVTFVQ